MDFLERDHRLHKSHGNQICRRIFADVVRAGACRRVVEAQHGRARQHQRHAVRLSGGYQLGVNDEAVFVFMAGGQPQFAALVAHGPLVPVHGFVGEPARFDDGAGDGLDSPYGCPPLMG